MLPYIVQACPIPKNAGPHVTGNVYGLIQYLYQEAQRVPDRTRMVVEQTLTRQRRKQAQSYNARLWACWDWYKNQEARPRDVIPLLISLSKLQVTNENDE